MRLEQLRQQANMESELLHHVTAASTNPSAEPLCGSGGTSFPDASPAVACNFFTTAAAAAIFRNVSYVHSCQF